MENIKITKLGIIYALLPHLDDLIFTVEEFSITVDFWNGEQYVIWFDWEGFFNGVDRLS